MQENEKTTGLPLSLDLPRKDCELHPSISQRNSVDSSFLVVGRLSRFKTAGSFKQLELKQLLYINLACLSVCVFVCLSVCLYPINVKTAEPIGPKFFVGPHGAPGKVYE